MVIQTVTSIREAEDRASSTAMGHAGRLVGLHVCKAHPQQRRIQSSFMRTTQHVPNDVLMLGGATTLQIAQHRCGAGGPALGQRCEHAGIGVLRWDVP